MVSVAALLLHFCGTPGAIGASAAGSEQPAPFAQGDRASRAGVTASDVAVRVRIAERVRPERITVAISSGAFDLVASGDARPRALLAGDRIVVNRAGRRLDVADPRESIALAEIRLDPRTAEARFSVRVDNGTRGFERVYDGSLEIRPAEEDDRALLIVNHVPLESYVAAVVASEYGLDDVEGARAMAILARTYALRTRGQPGTLYDHVDHELSQVYRGIESVTARAAAAAEATRGQVVLFAGALAETVYHADSGGHTANNDEVWDGRPVPYLRGVEDPHVSNSPYARWQYRAPRSRVLRALSAAFDTPVTGFVIASRSGDGRVSTVRLLSSGRYKSVSGNQFRLAVIRELGAASLKSMMFDVSVSGDAYVFSGSGFGHGVGLSQWGAHEMAKHGYTSVEIIAHYLRGTEVATLSLEAVDAATRVASRLEPLPATAPSRRSELGRIGW